jgi:hypothetical protein
MKYQTHARTMKDCQPQLCGNAHSVAIPVRSLLNGKPYVPSSHHHDGGQGLRTRMELYRAKVAREGR